MMTVRERIVITIVTVAGWSCLLPRGKYFVCSSCKPPEAVTATGCRCVASEERCDEVVSGPAAGGRLRLCSSREDVIVSVCVAMP